MENRNFMALTDDELYEVNGGNGAREAVQIIRSTPKLELIEIVGKAIEGAKLVTKVITTVASAAYKAAEKSVGKTTDREVSLRTRGMFSSMDEVREYYDSVRKTSSSSTSSTKSRKK